MCGRLAERLQHVAWKHQQHRPSRRRAAVLLARLLGLLAGLCVRVCAVRVLALLRRQYDPAVAVTGVLKQRGGSRVGAQPGVLRDASICPSHAHQPHQVFARQQRQHLPRLWLHHELAGSVCTHTCMYVQTLFVYTKQTQS